MFVFVDVASYVKLPSQTRFDHNVNILLAQNPLCADDWTFDPNCFEHRQENFDSEGNDIHMPQIYKYKNTNTQIQSDPNRFEQKQENCDS